MHEVDEQSSIRIPSTCYCLILFSYLHYEHFNIVILCVHNIPSTIHFAASLPFLLQNPIPSHFTVESIHFYFPSAPFHFQPTRFLEGKPRKHSKLVGARVVEGRWMIKLGARWNRKSMSRKSAWKRKLTRRERVSARLPRLGYMCNSFQPVVVVD